MAARLRCLAATLVSFGAGQRGRAGSPAAWEGGLPLHPGRDLRLGEPAVAPHLRRPPAAGTGQHLSLACIELLPARSALCSSRMSDYLVSAVTRPFPTQPDCRRVGRRLSPWPRWLARKVPLSRAAPRTAASPLWPSPPN